jgi:hypothetical protein
MCIPLLTDPAHSSDGSVNFNKTGKTMGLNQPAHQHPAPKQRLQIQAQNYHSAVFHFLFVTACRYFGEVPK